MCVNINIVTPELSHERGMYEGRYERHVWNRYHMVN